MSIRISSINRWRRGKSIGKGIAGCRWQLIKNMREAENGQVALEEVDRIKADLVVWDWNLPVMSGIELLRAIRADEDLKTIPVLMVMAEAKQGNILSAVQASVSDDIVKPFNAATLQEKLNKIFPK